MDKIDDLKLGDRVWIDSEVMFFAGYDAVDKEYIYLANKDNRVLERVNVNAEHISFTKPLPKLKRGQPFWVKDHTHAFWTPRFFICFRGKRCFASDPAYGWHIVHNDGIAWDEWKLPTRQELIDAGIDPEAWESMD